MISAWEDAIMYRKDMTIESIHRYSYECPYKGSQVPVYIDGQEYLTIREAEKVVQRALDTLRRWIRRGLVEAHKDGSGRWLIQRASLDRFLEGKVTDLEHGSSEERR